MIDPLVQFTKLEAIRDIEREVQQRWEREKTFEIDAPKVCAPLQQYNYKKGEEPMMSQATRKSTGTNACIHTESNLHDVATLY